MKKRYLLLPLFLLAFLLADAPQAWADTTPEMESRTAELSLEEYVVEAIENFEAAIDVSSYHLSRGRG